MKETYWLDETDPAELRRRADDFERECLLGLAQQHRERADFLEREHSCQKSRLQPISTAPDGPPGFLAFIVVDGEIDAVEWLQGPVSTDGCRLCLNSHNRNRFAATHWAPLPSVT